ncbi:mitochondrial distribution and morphology [Tilletia horrida]|uniref:Mitochondrial distribution and morphology n=1 Tax=Tilletia horrida TaxID=155126 RepID=A0AAN6GPZ8_9BASI|nr:mitochondrial distribution and morphology [Tilletia horrida]
MNTLDLINERQCAAIFRAIETRNLPRAVTEADKLLKKQPNLHLASSLKALALAQTRRLKESSTVCDQLLAANKTLAFSPAIVLPLSHTFEILGRDTDLVNVLDASSKAHPEAEDIAELCFTSLVKARQYQKAQQTAQRMHKTFKKDLYFWWSVQAYELLASRQPRAQGAALALALCERMVGQHLKSKPLTAQSDEVAHLYVTVLHKLGKDEEALQILSPNGDIGAQLCKRSLALELLRRELWVNTGSWTQIRKEAEAKIMAGEKDWAYVYALCQASARLDAADKSTASPTSLKQARQLLQERLNSERFTRVGSLAYLETFAQQKLLSPSDPLTEDTQGLVRTAIEAHLDAFGGKACAAADVMPYLLRLLSDSELAAINDHILGQFRSFAGGYDSEETLQRHITAVRLIQAVEAKLERSPTLTSKVLAERYMAGLPVGAHLPDTEGQPADELAILAAQRLLNETTEEPLSRLLEAAVFLQYACQRSKKGYRLRIFLIRILLQLGLFADAVRNWDLLKAAFIQHDTLGHLLLDRASVFGHTGDLANAEVHERLRMSQIIYEGSHRETNEMVKLAFSHGTFSKIEEVIDFGQRIERSFARQLYRLQTSKVTLTDRAGAKQSHTNDTLEMMKQNAAAVLEALRAKDDESTILMDASILAIATGVELTGRELEALGSLEGSNDLLKLAKGQLQLERGEVSSQTIEGSLNSFVTARIEAVKGTSLPFDLLQHSSQLLEAVSLLNLSALRLETKGSDLASMLKSSTQLQEAPKVVSAASRTIIQGLSNYGERIRNGSFLSAITSVDESKGSGQVDAIVESLLDKVERTLDDAAREFEVRLSLKA